MLQLGKNLTLIFTLENKAEINVSFEIPSGSLNKLDFRKTKIMNARAEQKEKFVSHIQ